MPFREMSAKIEHVLFDCDGVLIDTEIIAAHRFVARMHDLGIENLTVDYYLTHHTGSTFMQVLGHYLSESHSEQEQRIIMLAVEQEVADNVVGIAGVDEMLRQIDLPKSIVSNSFVQAVKNAVEKVKINHFFTGKIFSSELVENPKPAPDVYHLALEELNLSPDQILVVEDSLTGATAAMEAGLMVIGFTGASHILPGHDSRLTSMGVKHIASDMGELAKKVNQLIR